MMSRIPRIRPAIMALPVSPTLAANQAGAAARAEGKQVLQMGFGQSPFPVHPALAAALADNATHSAYEHVAGLASLREAALAYFSQRSQFDPSQYDVIVGPGSKLILYALQMAIEGDLLLPLPSWVSYAPQAALTGDQVIYVDAGISSAGYRLTAADLTAAIDDARAKGRNPRKLILNSPNNPTGLCIPPQDYAALTEVCQREGIFLISDEIYSLLTFAGTDPSIAATLPQQCAITTGLSKYLSLGGWRVGFGFIPKAIPGLFDAVCAIASETWSGVAAPIQRAALLAVSGDESIEAHIASCTRIHRAVACGAAQRLAAGGVRCPIPQGAFYLWPDFDALRAPLASKGLHTSEDIAAALLAQHGVLTLPGTAFGAPPERLALRLSVCDYDGAAALKACAGQDFPNSQLKDIAPRVIAATDAVVAFSQRWR